MFSLTSALVLICSASFVVSRNFGCPPPRCPYGCQPDTVEYVYVRNGCQMCRCRQGARYQPREDECDYGQYRVNPNDHYSYLQRLPNGYYIVRPCPPKTTWEIRICGCVRGGGHMVK